MLAYCRNVVLQVNWIIHFSTGTQLSSAPSMHGFPLLFGLKEEEFTLLFGEEI
jgi:hypothetical protein